MNALLAFLGFAALVVFHELGHFAAAKAVGMRVERFALFFPPLIGRIRRGETEYAIGAIPLGGYVKITGMNPEEELPDELKARSYSGSPVWKRVVVIAAGPLVNVVIAFVLLTGVFWHEGKPVPDISVVGVEQTQPAAGVLQEGDRILSVASTVKPPGGGSPEVARGWEAGLSTEQIAERTDRMVKLIGRAGCAEGAACPDDTPVLVTVQRAGETQQFEIVPAYDDQRDRQRIGVAFGGSREAIGPVDASASAVSGMWNVTKLTISTITRVVYDPQARKDTSSIVGGYEATRQSLAIDTVQAIWLLAFISLSLAIINLFPFLPLDGGHIFWALVEKLRGGKPVATATLERASIVGFMLVIALFMIGFTNDIGRITSGEGFGIR